MDFHQWIIEWNGSPYSATSEYNAIYSSYSYGVADWVNFYISIHLSRSSSLGSRESLWYILTDGTPSDGGHNAPFLHGVAMISLL